ncbi:MAG TPA: MarR family transcriptional regulator [Acidimicrobiia bacterium]|nr:MarR family transcriptional regulator [Acidimicrobiia bacterium]
MVAAEKTSPPELSDKLAEPGLRHVYESFLTNPEINFMMAAGAILRASKIIGARAEAVLAPLDLTLLRYEILARLDVADKGRLTVRDLKEAILLNSATMTYTLDHLEKRKLLKRHQDRSDRRVVIAEITPAGSRLIRQAHEALNAVHYGINGDLSEEQACEVAVVLSEIHSI